MITLVRPSPRDARWLKRHGTDLSGVLDRSYLVVRDGVIVGSVAYIPSTMAPEVLKIFPQFQGQGIGSEVLRQLVRSSNADAMEIMSVPKAVPFWRKLGFTTRSGWSPGTRGCVSMRKIL
jgi:predicted N-acetyltransferase YhbS